MIVNFEPPTTKNKKKSDELIALIDALLEHIEQDQDRLLEAHGTFRVERLITVIDEMRLREVVFNRIVK